VSALLPDGHEAGALLVGVPAFSSLLPVGSVIEVSMYDFVALIAVMALVGAHALQVVGG
jgi:hypothetical protein